ncbi:purine-binding chemotaxis protein CheW [Paenibacillus sp. IB182493]|uniref:Purine-binding chemotaxis protein CheW n=2 Tax=Paenibacillus arenilitoris TaxID=2772299 RepID=A0A927CU12_9BACL|nr:purine-binding chemotaxis protein CheW [Paenibacillus arenilitoris]
MLETAGNEPFVEFGIGEERIAIRIAEINAIIRIQPIIDIPGRLNYVEGVIYLRGKIVPIVSLRAKFGLEPGSYTKAARIVLLHHTGKSAGIIVDRVNQVTTFKDIQPPPEKVGGISGSYFAGIGITDRGLAAILSFNEQLNMIESAAMAFKLKG